MITKCGLFWHVPKFYRRIIFPPQRIFFPPRQARICNFGQILTLVPFSLKKGLQPHKHNGWKSLFRQDHVMDRLTFPAIVFFSKTYWLETRVMGNSNMGRSWVSGHLGRRLGPYYGCGWQVEKRWGEPLDFLFFESGENNTRVKTIL